MLYVCIIINNTVAMSLVSVSVWLTGGVYSVKKVYPSVLCLYHY